MTELYPDAELATTNVSGSASDLRDNDTAAGYSPDDADSGWDARWSMDNAGAALSGTQTVRVFMSPFNGTDSAVTIDLYEAGSVVSTLVSGHQLSSGDEEVSGTFADTAVSDPGSVEIAVEVARGGGMPGSRANSDCLYITWDASLDIFVDVTTLAATGVTTEAATLNGSVDWTDSTVDVWFEWGEVGAGFPNTTPAQTITATGTQSFDEGVTGLSEDTEYEYRAHADRDNGAETDQGLVETFWTEPVAPAAPTNLTGDFV